MVSMLLFSIRLCFHELLKAIRFFNNQLIVSFDSQNARDSRFFLFCIFFRAKNRASLDFIFLNCRSTQNTLRNSLNFSCFWFFLRAHLRNAIRFSFQIQMIHISVSSLNSENLFSFFIRFSILNHKEFFLCNFLYLLCFIRSHIAPKLRTSPFFAVSHDFFVW